MSRAWNHWIAGVAVLVLALSEIASSGASADEGLKHEATPAEGEVGTRATPMLKQGLQRSPGIQIPMQPGVMATPSPAPMSSPARPWPV